MACWSSAVILVWSSTWLIEWGPSGESWIISAEASWLGLAGALMMWYHSEPELVFVPECGCTCLCGCVSVSLCQCSWILSVWVCVCLYVCMHSDVCTYVHERTCVCALECVCVCSRLLPPTGWSFTFRTGRRDRRLPGCARSLGTVRLAMPGIH